MSRRQSYGGMTATRTQVASLSRAAYLQVVSLRQLLSLLLTFALLLAPVGMSGAAMAGVASLDAVAATGADHCAGMDQPDKEQPDNGADCLSMCSAIPADRAKVGDQLIVKASHQQVPATADQAGDEPEATTPPPRLS